GALGVGGVELALGLLHLVVEDAEVVHQLVLALLLRERGVGLEALVERLLLRLELPLDAGDLLAHVGDDEEGDVLAGRLRDELAALVGHLDLVELLLQREVERLVHLGHALGVVLEVEELRLAEELLDAGLALELDERLVAGEAALGAEEREAGLLFELGRALPVPRLGGGLALLEQALGVGDEAGDDLLLAEDELLDVGVELLEAVLVALRDGAGDDQRRARLVD